MRNELDGVLKGHDADYVEIRLEESQVTRIVYRGERLEEIGRTSSLGGNVRVLSRGGWGFVSFNHADNLRDRIELAVKQARLVGKEDSRFVLTGPVVDIVAAETKKNPTTVLLASKKQLFDEYNDIILSTPKIQTSSIGYHDSQRKTTFANSEGAYIGSEELLSGGIEVRFQKFMFRIHIDRMEFLIEAVLVFNDPIRDIRVLNKFLQ